MKEDIKVMYKQLMNNYNYNVEEDCDEFSMDGNYYQLSAPGYNEMGNADIIAQII